MKPEDLPSDDRVRMNRARSEELRVASTELRIIAQALRADAHELRATIERTREASDRLLDKCLKDRIDRQQRMNRLPTAYPQPVVDNS